MVEGVGDHGCEYMTGGKVVVLGKTGRNFAAGMSGGIAYIYDPDKRFSSELCNLQMVDLEQPTEIDLQELKQLIENHQRYTDSELANRLLSHWDSSAKDFVKVFPVDYKKALERLAKETEVEQLIA